MQVSVELRVLRLSILELKLPKSGERVDSFWRASSAHEEDEKFENFLSPLSPPSQASVLGELI